ncbi:hypothetical protein D3C87_1627960 [compost metagenome]
MADLFRKTVEKGLDDARQRHGGKTAGSKPQNLGRHSEELAVIGGVTHFRQCQQTAPRGGAVKACDVSGI